MVAGMNLNGVQHVDALRVVVAVAANINGNIGAQDGVGIGVHTDRAGCGQRAETDSQKSAAGP
jgi:hypothetical protein